MKRKLLKLLMLVLTLSLLTACVQTSEPKDELVQNEPDQEIIEDDIVVNEDEIFNEDDYVEEEVIEEEEKEDKKEESKKPEASKPVKLNKYRVLVNRQTNVVTVYTYDEQGNYTVPVKAMVCSTGKNNRTPTGTFKMSSKHRWQLMNGDVYSQYASRIVGHILFHSVPYVEPKNDTLKINYYNQLGKQASAGCVRLTTSDAKWIYNNCPSGTVVKIFDGTSKDDPLGKPSAMTLSTNHPCAGWDPTDPDSRNPWKTMPPTLSLVASTTIELGSSDDLSKLVKAVDVYGKTLKVSIKGDYNLNKLGTYHITFNAKDSRGNGASLSSTITIKDTTAPTIKYDGKDVYDGDLNDLETYINNHLTYKDLSRLQETKVTISIDEEAYKIYVSAYAIDDSNNKKTLEFTIDIYQEELPEETPGDEIENEDIIEE